jgi:hypothetical protein
VDSNLDKEGTPDLSEFLSNTITALVDKQNEIATSPSSRLSPSREDIALTRAFMDCDLDNIEEFDAMINLSLGEMFPAASNNYEPAIFIKDDAYSFSVDPKIIKMVEDNKFYGKEEEFPSEHLSKLIDYATLFGKDEIQQHYYFLKLFPFSLGGDAKNWY